MGLIDELTRLDQTVLPRLARGLVRIIALLRLVRVRPLVAVTVVLVLAVAVTTVLKLGEPAGVPGNGPFFRIGISAGASVSEYVADSAFRLDRLAAGPDARVLIYALVSFTAYLDPERVTALASAGGPQLQTIRASSRVPMPRRQTNVVWFSADRLPADLIAGMMAEADRRAADVTAYTEKLKTTTDDDLRHTYQTNIMIGRAEQAAYATGHCDCVFSLVVRGAPAVLQRLSGASGVRVVDPAPLLASLDANVLFLPPRPEETGLAGPPADDDLPSTPTAGVTPAAT